MRETFQNIAELLSGMTFPTVVLRLQLSMWLPSARKAWKRESGHDWFIMGVAIGFCGAALDNIYWFMPWTASYLGHPAFSDLTNAGVFFNIVFRQGLNCCGILSFKGCGGKFGPQAAFRRSFSSLIWSARYAITRL